MLLSIYTSVRNGLFYDYHVVDMIKHHLPLADEIIVNDGCSTDGTYEAVSRLDPVKVKVFRSDWGKPTDLGWITRFKNAARSKCRGLWCINLDCDEFIPEWEFERLRARLERSSALIHPLRIINFYGNYKVFHLHPERVPWPDVKRNIHRNLPEIEVWGDGSNVRVKTDPGAGKNRRWNSTVIISASSGTPRAYGKSGGTSLATFTRSGPPGPRNGSNCRLSFLTGSRTNGKILSSSTTWHCTRAHSSAPWRRTHRSSFGTACPCITT